MTILCLHIMYGNVRFSKNAIHIITSVYVRTRDNVSYGSCRFIVLVSCGFVAAGHN